MFSFQIVHRIRWQSPWGSCEFICTSPTPMRRDSTVESRRRCVLGFSLYAISLEAKQFVATCISVRKFTKIRLHRKTCRLCAILWSDFFNDKMKLKVKLSRILEQHYWCSCSIALSTLRGDTWSVTWSVGQLRSSLDVRSAESSHRSIDSEWPAADHWPTTRRRTSDAINDHWFTAGQWSVPYTRCLTHGKDPRRSSLVASYFHTVNCNAYRRQTARISFQSQLPDVGTTSFRSKVKCPAPFNGCPHEAVIKCENFSDRNM